MITSRPLRTSSRSIIRPVLRSVFGASSTSRSLSLLTSLPSAFTFTRASGSTLFDVSGTLVSVGNDIASIGYDAATHLQNGCKIYAQLTNVFLNSQAPATQSIAVTAQAYTLSFYGTGNIVRSGVSTGTLTGTGAAVLSSVTFTPTAGSLTLTCAGSLTNVQLVAGSLAGPRIITAGVSATRAADFLRLSDAAFAQRINPAAGTLFLDILIPGATTNLGRFIEMNDGTTSNSMSLLVSAGAGQINLTVSGVSVTSGFTLPTADVTHRLGLRWGSGAGRAAVDGALVGSSVVSAIPPVTRIDLMNRADGTRPGNGHVLRFAAYTTAMSDAQFAALSNLSAALP